MRGYEGAEICELVGLYILHILGEKYRKDEVGLYHDDSLTYFESINGSQAEQIRKEFILEMFIFRNEFKLKNDYSGI